MKDSCHYLEWDSSFFGLRIGRVADEGGPEISFEAIDSWAHARDIDCLYLLLGASNGESVRLAEENGFRQVDIRMTLEHRAVEFHEPPGEGVRVCDSSDLAELKRHARQHHEATRFFKDRRFPRDRSAELYAHWLDKTFSSPNAQIFLTEQNGRPTGYIACEFNAEKAGRISLAGVDPEHRGKGIGTTLVRSALQWLVQNGTHSRTVITQGANIPALRLYTSNGFYPVSTQLWYHKWFGPTPS